MIYTVCNRGETVMSEKEKIINIAVIAHVDAGKSTLVDAGSLTVIKSKNIGKPLKYGFFFVKFLFLYVVCVVIMI